MGTSAAWVGRMLVVGASHRTSALGIRDRLFVEQQAMPQALAALRDAGMTQAMILCTCDRVEVAAVDDDVTQAGRRIAEVLAAHAELAPEELAPHLHLLSGAAAVRHLFAVTASLNSLVVGEPHVLGQVKASHEQARRAGMVGGELEATMQAAYEVAKRVRSETGIAQRPVSIAAAAVELARDLHGSLGRCRGLLLGTGEIGLLLAETLRASGLEDLIVIHPQDARAEAAAETLSCHLAPFAALAERLAEADIMISALGSRQYVVSAAMLRAALKRRRNRPVFVVDAAVPGDVDPGIDRLDAAFRYTLDDLEGVAMRGRALRESEVSAAETLIDEALEAFVRGRAERAAAPLLAALRRHFEAARVQAVRDAGGDADKATRLLVSRLLHGPSEALRAIAAEGDDAAGLEAVERILDRLFDLNRRSPEEER